MPLYEYRAYDLKGKVVTGIIDAPSRKLVYDRLKAKALYPKEITEDRAQNVQGTVKRDELSFVMAQLATLLKAGIPITKALDSIYTQVESKVLSRSLARLKSSIEEGRSMAKAMAADPVFPSLLVKMAQAGETVGNLDGILERYAQFLDKESQSVKKIVGAMIYPSVIFLASIVLIVFILIYVAPTLIEVFDGFNAKLPMMTALLVGAGTFVKKYIILLALLIAGAVIAYRRYVPKRFKDDLKLRIPFIGQAYLYMMLGRWARTLGMLHSGGVPLIRALEAAREVVDNESFEKELIAVERSVEKGYPLPAALSRLSFFPTLLVNMVETGQQTGELEKMMDVVAEFYEKEMDRKLTVFFQLMEPAMILILGIIIGFVVVSILLPIFEINRMVR